MPVSFGTGPGIRAGAGPGSSSGGLNAGRFAPSPSGVKPWSPPPASPPPAAAAAVPAAVAGGGAAGGAAAGGVGIGAGVAAGAIAAGAALGAGVGMVIDEANHPNDGALSWLKRDPFFRDPSNPYRSLFNPDPPPDALNPGNFPKNQPGLVPPTGSFPGGVAIAYFSPNNASSYTREWRKTPPYLTDPGWKFAYPILGYRIEPTSSGTYARPYSTPDGTYVSRPDWDYALSVQGLDGVWRAAGGVEPATIQFLNLPKPGETPNDPYPIGDPTFLPTPAAVANPDYQSNPDPRSYSSPSPDPIEAPTPTPFPAVSPDPARIPGYLPGFDPTPTSQPDKKNPVVPGLTPTSPPKIGSPEIPSPRPVPLPPSSPKISGLPEQTPGSNPFTAGQVEPEPVDQIDQKKIGQGNPTPEGCSDPCVAKLLKKAEEDEAKPKTSKISIPVFLGCNPKPLSDFDLAIFRLMEITVPTEAAESLQLLHSELFDLQKAGCKEKNEPIAAVPDWWQIRLGANLSQLVVQYAEETPEGLIGSPKYVISIPHYSRNYAATNASLFPPYIKGNRMGILTLPDNSKLIVNAQTEAEAERVINSLKLLIPMEMAQNAVLGTGQRKGVALKQIKVVPRIAKFFATGQQNLKPTWIKYF